MHIHFIYTFTDVHVTSRLLAQYHGSMRVLLFIVIADAIHINMGPPATTTTVAVHKTFHAASRIHLTTFHVRIFGKVFSWSRIGGKNEQDHQHQDLVRRHFSDDSSLYEQHTVYTDTDRLHACFAYKMQQDTNTIL